MPIPIAAIIPALVAGGTLVPHASGGLLVSAWQKTPNFQKLVLAQSRIMRMVFFPGEFFVFIDPKMIMIVVFYANRT